MIAGFFITLRETLEAVLVVGIVLAYLVKINQPEYKKFVGWGILFGIVVSIVGALIFMLLLGGLKGRTEELFEGILMFIAAGLLTTMIFRMVKQGRYVARELEERVSHEISQRHAVGILFLVFFAVLREGIETVIFLGAASRIQATGLLGPLLGIVVALTIGWLFFWAATKLTIKWFFEVTSTILILFAAGLIAHGVHELQEAGVLPVLIENVWDMNWLINEKGTLGGILKALFGYNGTPSLIELVGWSIYLILIFRVYKSIEEFPHRLKKRP